LASTLNDVPGQVLANAAVVVAGSNGSVDAYGSNSTDLIIDINGYYAVPADFLDNTGIGAQALPSITTGQANTAFGKYALYSNTTGDFNTALGKGALLSSIGASYNTGVGIGALSANSTGHDNTAVGSDSATNNTSGCCNTSVGSSTLLINQTGSFNIALGYGAGYIPGGSSNIAIGNSGDAADNYTIRIGTGGSHNRFFAAGISGATTGGPSSLVVIDGNGQLGTIISSRRFKQDIADMNDASDALLRLRPVVFRYKQPYEDGSKPIDYGLVAEEVEQVYPDLVVRDKDGKIQTVQYQKLTPMLLNELQKEHERGERQAETIREQAEIIGRQAEQIRTHEDRLAAIEWLLKSK
jgi:hypothetical protein